MQGRLTPRFLRWALSNAVYRSYRDRRTKALVAKLRVGNDDLVGADLAFSLPPRSTPSVERHGKSPLVVGVAPIVYGRTGSWPTPNQAVYARYAGLLARFVISLAQAGREVVLFYSDLGDEAAVAAILEILKRDLPPDVLRRISCPTIRSVHDLRAVIDRLDCVISSRLHATLLSHAACKPVVAISFDPKVDTHMAELAQGAYRLDIHDFSLEELSRQFERLLRNQQAIEGGLQTAVARCRRDLQRQYDEVLGALAYGG
jgi:polysaccharide pyruvyl transferase WcaK-like protein